MTSKLPPYEVYLIKIAVLIKALWKSSVRNVYHPLEYLCETSIADSTCMKLMNVKNMHHPPEYLCETSIADSTCMKLINVKHMHHPPEYLCETSIADSTCMKLINVKHMHHPPEYLCETSIADSTCMKLIMMCYDCAASRTAPGLLQCQWRCCQCAGRRGAYLEYQVQEGNSRIHLPLPGQTQFPFFILNPAWDCGSKKSVQSPKPFFVHTMICFSQRGVSLISDNFVWRTQSIPANEQVSTC